MIDPKVVIGERIFEIAAFLRNPMPELIAYPGALALTQRRIQQFADSLPRLSFSTHDTMVFCTSNFSQNLSVGR